MTGYVRRLAVAAREAQLAIAAADAATRRALLESMADHLLSGQDAILAANAGDLAKAAEQGASKARPLGVGDSPHITERVPAIV